jgi:hypothetical protein
LVNEHEPLTRSACTTARLDAAIDDHALSVGTSSIAISPRPLCEPDGRTGLSPTNVGALGDACITDNGMHRHCVRVQTFGRVGQTVQAGHFSRKPVGLPNYPTGDAVRHEMALIGVCH